VEASGGDPKQVTHEGKLMAGHAWQPDGSAIVYSSARSATTLYLPIMQLYSQALAGGAPRQLTFGDLGYQNPDVGRDGRVVASRWRMQFDIWKYPVDGKDARENARRGVRITEQTGQVQTPTLSPDESQVAFLSDSGSHGNIWAKDLKTGELRQITHERDPNVVLGVPVWSPDGSQIVVAISRYLDPGTDVGYWALAPDGSGYHMVMRAGSWATWSPDGKWLYYSLDSPVMPKAQWDIMRIPIAGGDAQRVREDGGMSPMLSPDGKTLYWVAPLPLVNGKKDHEIRKAEPEGAPSSTLLLRIASERLPTWQGLHPVVSHSGKWLALTLNDEYGTNLWVLNTNGGEAKKVVDFGERRTFIARRVAWSRDDNWIYAAVGEGDADVVSLNGLLK
jgi:Tol biopolymer transport system component